MHLLYCSVLGSAPIVAHSCADSLLCGSGRQAAQKETKQLIYFIVWIHVSDGVQTRKRCSAQLYRHLWNPRYKDIACKCT
jgi:hypothetical protein